MKHTYTHTFIKGTNNKPIMNEKIQQLKKEYEKAIIEIKEGLASKLTPNSYDSNREYFDGRIDAFEMIINDLEELSN